VVTHDSRVYSFADRIASMEDGRIDSIARGPHRTGGSSAPGISGSL
jgi:hypothetical protein